MEGEFILDGILSPDECCNSQKSEHMYLMEKENF